MTGMVWSQTSFILSSQFREIGSPPTVQEGRRSLVMPASVIHIWPIHISWGKILHLNMSTISVFWQYDTFWCSAIILLKKGKDKFYKRNVELFRFRPTLILLYLKEREMFYLTTHSTHFIYGYMASDMVKDHSDSEKGNPLSPHRLLFPINSKGSFICTIPLTR